MELTGAHPKGPRGYCGQSRSSCQERRPLGDFSWRTAVGGSVLQRPSVQVLHRVSAHCRGSPCVARSGWNVHRAGIRRQVSCSEAQGDLCPREAQTCRSHRSGLGVSKVSLHLRTPWAWTQCGSHSHAHSVDDAQGSRGRDASPEDQDPVPPGRRVGGTAPTTPAWPVTFATLYYCFFLENVSCTLHHTLHQKGPKGRCDPTQVSTCTKCGPGSLQTELAHLNDQSVPSSLWAVMVTPDTARGASTARTAGRPSPGFS